MPEPESYRHFEFLLDGNIYGALKSVETKAEMTIIKDDFEKYFTKLINLNGIVNQCLHESLETMRASASEREFNEMMAMRLTEEYVSFAAQRMQADVDIYYNHNRLKMLDFEMSRIDDHKRLFLNAKESAEKRCKEMMTAKDLFLEKSKKLAKECSSIKRDDKKQNKAIKERDELKEKNTKIVLENTLLVSKLGKLEDKLNVLSEESKSKDKKINELEDKLMRLRQVLDKYNVKRRSVATNFPEPESGPKSGRNGRRNKPTPKPGRRWYSTPSLCDRENEDVDCRIIKINCCKFYGDFEQREAREYARK